MDTPYEVIIIGAGPAGLTAALYTSRAKLRTLILEKESLGGELMNRDVIDNYPGYPDGILGPELGSNMVRQAKNYGAEIKLGEVEKIESQQNYKVVTTTSGNYLGKTVIIAGGASPEKLGVPGEQEFADRGVIYCATCDGYRFTDKVVAVAGGGDSGITEALFLARVASKVIIIERMPNCTANRTLMEKALSNTKFEIKCGVKIEAIRGSEQVEALELCNVPTGQKEVLEVDGILVHVGIKPNTDYLEDSIPLNDKGQIIVNENMETAIAGIFAVGDIRHNSPGQISTAVGDGATAALSLQRQLTK
ncbi:NAD(P)/FAD-dependent oxidoreductase [Chloroflexota bacterium]